jgi:hypothetical protein
MARSPSPLLLAAALLAAAPLLAACNREISCTTEVTAGSGVFRGIAAGTRSEPDLRRESLRIACGQLCAAGGPAAAEGCVGRCAVDVESAKIGGRTSCTKEGGR